MVVFLLNQNKVLGVLGYSSQTDSRKCLSYQTVSSDIAQQEIAECGSYILGVSVWLENIKSKITSLFVKAGKHWLYYLDADFIEGVNHIVRFRTKNKSSN